MEILPVKIDRNNGRGRWGCFRLELKLQNYFGSYLALGTTDKPIRILVGRTFCFMNRAYLCLKKLC